MSKEYIEREAARDLMEQALVDEWEIQYADDRLDEIHAADVVEVRHGHWVLSDTYIAADHCRWNVWTCSECGYRRKAGWEHTEDGRKPDARYCENCMAKMDGGADDDDHI